MFFRLALPCLLLAVAITAVHFGGDVVKLPEHIPALIPLEVIAFAKGLTHEDKAVLRELAARAKEFDSNHEVLAAIKRRSASLHAKLIALFTLLEAKIDVLDSEAKTFIRESIAAVCAFSGIEESAQSIKKAQKVAHNLIRNYRNLSDGAKADLEGQFPYIGKLDERTLEYIATRYIKGARTSLHFFLRLL